MQTRKRYCIDLDGVVVNFHDGFMELLRKDGVIIPKGYVPTKWDWYHDFASRPQIDRAWKKVKDDPSWWYGLESFLRQEAVEDLEYIADKHDIIFLSARSLCPSNIAQAWVNDNIGPYTTIVVDTWEAKLPLLATLVPDIYVDDHILTLASVHKPTKCYTVPWPYTLVEHDYEIIDINKLIRSLR